MTQSITNVSTLGTHTRGLVIADRPLHLSNLLPNSAFSVSRNESTTTFVEVRLSLDSLFVLAAIGDDGVIAAGVSAIRVTAAGPDIATVETLQRPLERYATAPSSEQQRRACGSQFGSAYGIHHKLGERNHLRSLHEITTTH